MMRRVGHNDKLKFCSPGGPVFQLCRNNATYCPREDDGWQSDTIGIIEAMTGPFEWGMNEPLLRDLKPGLLLHKETRQQHVNHCGLMTVARRIIHTSEFLV